MLSLFFALRSALPRLTAAEGLFLLAWPKRNKNPRLASFLVKSYGNFDCGSIEALSPCLSHRARFDPALGCGGMRGTAKISVLFPAEICEAG